MDRRAADVISDDAIRTALLDLANARGSAKSFCPSEVARTVGDATWRDLMPEVRRVAQTLIEQGQIVATQRGEVVDLATARGPIRLRRASPEDSAQYASGND